MVERLRSTLTEQDSSEERKGKQEEALWRSKEKACVVEWPQSLSRRIWIALVLLRVKLLLKEDVGRRAFSEEDRRKFVRVTRKGGKKASERRRKIGEN